jgi:hypothetical protein
MSVSVTPLKQPQPVNRLRSVATITVVGTEPGGAAEFVRVKVNGVMCDNIDLSAGKTAAVAAALIGVEIIDATNGVTADRDDAVITVTSDDGSPVSISIMSDTATQTYTVDSAIEDMKAFSDVGAIVPTVPGDGIALPQCDRIVYVVTYKNSSAGTQVMAFSPMVYDKTSGQWGAALVEYGVISGADGAPEEFSQNLTDQPLVGVATKTAETARVVITNHGYNRVGIMTDDIAAGCLVDVWIYGVNNQ